MKTYSIIYADPPWKFSSNSQKKPGRNVLKHYPTMTIDEIKSLPIREISAQRSVLFLWATYPLLDKALEVIDAWGFNYKTVAFTWAKLRSDAEIMFQNWYTTNTSLLGIKRTFQETLRHRIWHMGLGFYTRANPEICLLATKGAPLPRQNRDIPNLVVAPVGKHSAKPPEVRERIERLFGDLPRIELFAREKPKGWDVWGNEVKSDIELLR